MKINSQMERAQLENVTVLPTAATSGRISWNTVDGKIYLDDATNWRAILRNDGKAILGNSATASDNIRFHRGAAGVLQLVSGADVTAEGILSTVISQLGFRASNYSTASLPAFGNIGRIAYDTTTFTPKVDSGSAWKELVDTTTAQTLSSKSLLEPIFSSTGIFTQIATPSAPGVGFTRLYSKLDGKFYYMAPDGFEKAIGSGSGSGTNYLVNPDAESATTGWVTYANAAGVTPTTGIGGAPTTTFTRSTTTPLHGAASFLLSKPATNTQGEGVSTDFVIDRADLAKQVSISFDYEVVSGSYTDGELAVYIYDVTNSQLIQPAGFSILNAVGPASKGSCTFQTSSNSVSYRLIIHTASTSAVAFSMRLDALSVSPVLRLSGVPVSDWTSYIPSLTSSGGGAVTIASPSVSPWGRWRRVGDSIEIQAGFTIGASAATGAAGNLKIGFPTGIFRDTSATTSSVSDAAVGAYLGHAYVSNVTNASVSSYDVYADGTYCINAGSNTVATVANLTPGWALSSLARFRVIGWSSNVIASSDAATRVVGVIADISGTHTVSGSFQDVPTLTPSFDSHAAMSGTTFTAPVPGLYRFSGTIGFTALNSGIRAAQLMITGQSVSARTLFQVNFTNGFDMAQPYSDLVQMRAGDTAKLQVYQNSGGNLGYTASRFDVDRISGPAQIAASEVVAFTAKDSSTTATAATPFLFTTIGGDTHGAYNAATGKFTVPAPGWHKIDGKVYTGASSNAITLNVDGIAVAQGLVNNASNAPALISELLYLTTGQTIEIRPTSPVTATGGATLNSFSVFRLGGVG